MRHGRLRTLSSVAAALSLLAVGTSLPALAQVAPKDPTVTSLTIFAGTGTGLWRSRTWGGTWERVTAPAIQSAGVIRCILAMGPRVYACGDGGLFVSEDFGGTWSASYSESAVLGVMPSRYPLADPTVFLATPRGLLRSEDAGRSFRPTTLADTAVHRIEWPGPALVLATGRGIVVSKDGGASFSGPGAGLPEGSVEAFAVSSFFAVDPVLFAAGSDGGVFRSADGGSSWHPAGLEGRAVSDLVWLGPFLYAGTDAGVFRSESLGKNWSPLSEGLGGRSATRLLFPLAPASGAEFFLATNRGVFFSGDGGAHWRASGLEGEAVSALGTFPPPDPVRKKKK
jgi:photosystem II stability/assembly factor-like uncharacterized protein